MAKTYGVPLPGTATNTQLFNALVSNGQGDLDNSAVIAVIEQLAQVTLNTEEA
jgi:2-hydroxy-3-oxopropionate reductase